MRPTLEEYLAFEYSFNVIADPNGGYVIVYPDLPGCLSIADSLDEVILMAVDARVGWLTTAYELGVEIPRTSYPIDTSEKAGSND